MTKNAEKRAAAEGAKSLARALESGDGRSDDLEHSSSSVFQQISGIE
jgi:hypothetical protein